jgi:hypothetical protein
MIRNLSVFLMVCAAVHFPAAQNPGPRQTARTIWFAGVEWNVKNGGPMGPGPNYWSDSESSVWLDEQNRLHMTIRKSGNTWYCSEIYTIQFTTYGEHRFLVEGYIDRMDKNIVLGLFTYANDNAEIDIEYSKWGDASNSNVGSFTIQPYDRPGNNHPFASPLSSPHSTHHFDWQPSSITFASMYGHHYGEPPAPADYIEQWTYTGADNPAASENLRTHINFWLMSGRAPTDLSILEVIITDVAQPLNSSSIDYKTRIGIAAGFHLNQNYPNPFNSGTTISYLLRAPGDVELAIYNLSGQNIATVINTTQSPGKHIINWEAGSLPSGLYLCRLKSGGKQQFIKMLLTR